MFQLRFIGSCMPLFIMAIVFDITGLVLLLFGIFGDVQKRGVFYGDFLIHTGALLLFASLGFWLMWYVGNIRVKEEDLERRSSTVHSVKNLARKLTERLSKTHNNDTGEKAAGKASTIRNVTWGKSTYVPGLKDPETDTISCDELSKENGGDEFTCYQNKGYEDEEASVTKGDDSSQEEKQDQTPEESVSDVSNTGETSEETKPDSEFTCYQNEGYEDSESDVTKGAEQTENCDTLL
ncbi:uncharacterized protein LOC130426561 [Triplophysa dalaica]|uniref:uncharacterized protein LOC130426561 n=1 Tax=Triplophysa dalaica TaxID=1582913 RepID=UPI0024DFBC31|nr:uncharacterized protein LOC130426561 [Triplophysa dalaica]